MAHTERRITDSVSLLQGLIKDILPVQGDNVHYCWVTQSRKRSRNRTCSFCRSISISKARENLGQRRNHRVNWRCMQSHNLLFHNCFHHLSDLKYCTFNTSICKWPMLCKPLCTSTLLIVRLVKLPNTELMLISKHGQLI